MGLTPIKSAAAALASTLVACGLVVTPAAHAAITRSQIKTPSDPSFFAADENGGAQTFSIKGTTSGGNRASDRVDVNCYSSGSIVTVATDVPVARNGSFSIPKASLAGLLGLTCRLRAVPAGTQPPKLASFAGPVIGADKWDLDRVDAGPNAGKVTGYLLQAQQRSGAFEYMSLGGCGLDDGYLYDAAFAQTTTTFYCNAALFPQNSPSATRSEIRIGGANAYDPYSANLIAPNARGLPSLGVRYRVDRKTGNVVIHETDPLARCVAPAYPPTAATCARFVSAGVTDHRTITQDHGGRVTRITDSFTSTDRQAHSLDLLWDNSQHFWGASGDSTQLVYEFPGQRGFATHVAGDRIKLRHSGGTILIRMRGAADGDKATGRGAIVFDRRATAAKFTLVQSSASEFTLHQTANVPARRSTRFRFAYVQGYRAATVASLVKTAKGAFSAAGARSRPRRSDRH
jgi:hypothetical protein